MLAENTNKYFFLPFPGGNVENKTLLSWILEFEDSTLQLEGGSEDAWEGSIVGKVIYNQDRLLLFIPPLPTRKTKNLSQGVLKQTDPPLVLGIRNWFRLIRRPTQRKSMETISNTAAIQDYPCQMTLKFFFKWQNIPDIKCTVLTNFRCTSQWYFTTLITVVNKFIHWLNKS